MDGLVIAACIASILVTAVSAVWSFLLMKRAKAMAAHPIVLCTVAGLLVGIALLVVMPESVERLVRDRGWQADYVFLLFLLAPMVMFLVEHVVAEHAHTHRHGRIQQAEEAHVIDVSTGETQISTGKKATIKFNKGLGGGLQGCKPVGAPNEATKLLEDEARAREQWAAALGMGFRLAAWTLHAALDGVLLATCKSITVLVPFTCAVAICSLSDVAGLYVYFRARKCTDSFMVLALGSFCCAFPLGTAITLVAMHSGGSGLALDPMRCVMAGLFVYMGFFELMPQLPDPSERKEILKHYLGFSLGLLIAYVADMIEDSMRAHGERPHAAFIL